MIIKSLTRKGNRVSTIQQLLSYFFQEKKQNDFLLLQNITGTKIQDYTKTIMLNEKNRVHPRKNSVLVYHDILSIHQLDSKHLTQKKLKAIAKKYLRLRNAHALSVAVPHYDKQSIHIHFAISGIDQSGISTRVSKSRFHEIKMELQNAFPELEHSQVMHGKGQTRVSEKEYQIRKRGVVTEKEQINATVKELYLYSDSQNSFFAKLKKQGYKLYERKGNVAGIIGKRKIRFRTLGIDLQYLRNKELYVSEFGKVRDTSFHQNIKSWER
ncbi:MAG: hypothetical protein JWN78_1610 [Bacteroidota bacterium]|nr:hypothetical protein [Bacteroidota bacterium]